MLSKFKSELWSEYLANGGVTCPKSGRQIKANVKALRSKGRVWRFEGECLNGKKQVVCNSKWSAMIMDRNNV